jgi:hypothetical protein
MNLIITKVVDNRITGLYDFFLENDQGQKNKVSVLEKYIPPLMRFFKTDSLRLLAKDRKIIESECNDYKETVDLFLQSISDEWKDLSPSEKVFQTAAESLAKFEPPDLSFVDNETRFLTFLKVWRGYRADPIWLAKFKAQINTLSRNKVHLIDVDQEEFPVGINGEHLILVRHLERQKIVISTDFVMPIEFIF